MVALPIYGNVDASADDSSFADGNPEWTSLGCSTKVSSAGNTDCWLQGELPELPASASLWMGHLQGSHSYSLHQHSVSTLMLQEGRSSLHYIFSRQLRAPQMPGPPRGAPASIDTLEGLAISGARVPEDWRHAHHFQGLHLTDRLRYVQRVHVSTLTF
jgi:hypothetical protein